ILARAVIHDLPEYQLYFGIPAIQFGKRVMRNFNPLIDRYPGADGMKTGFICASGYNLVATATRGGRRLIAVVLGARSGMARAEKAAQLLERGFTGGGGLSWLIPSFGTVNSLQPMDVPPTNLREQICNASGKRRHAHSDNDEEAAAGQNGDSSSSLSMVAGFQLGPPPQGSLLGTLQPSMPPIPVYLGPARAPGAAPVASAPATKKSRPHKTAAQTATQPAGQAGGTPKGELGAG